MDLQKLEAQKYYKDRIRNIYGTQAKAAKALGIAQNTLSLNLKRLTMKFQLRLAEIGIPLYTPSSRVSEPRTYYAGELLEMREEIMRLRKQTEKLKQEIKELKENDGINL